jgi:hypothetical protein
MYRTTKYLNVVKFSKLFLDTSVHIVYSYNVVGLRSVRVFVLWKTLVYLGRS